ncbi:MAG TPA: hypothetical protein VGB72_04310 [Acidobacteriota bacterium]
MERRDFFGRAGCGMAAFLAGSTLLQSDQESQKQPLPPPAAKPKKYKIDIEIFEARQDSWCHKKGDTFKYPEDMHKICPWLLSSLHDFIILLQRGVTLPWKYEGTPYEKVIDPEGVTTEYIRCPDPTSNLVAKIIRTKVD